MRSVEEHLTKILELVEPLPPYEQPLLEALGLPICEDVTSSIDLPELRQLRDGRLCRAGATTCSTHARTQPVRLPVVGESAAGQTQGVRAHARPGGQDHDRRADAGRRRRGRPDRVDRRRPRQRVEITPGADARRARASARRRHPGRATRSLEEGTTLGPREAMILAATGHGRCRHGRDRASSCSRPARSCASRVRRSASTRSTTPTRSRSRPRPRQADAIAYRVGIVTDDPQELTDTLSDQLVRADLVVTSGGVSKGDYDVVKDVLGRLGTVRVRRGGDAARQAAGLRHDR